MTAALCRALRIVGGGKAQSHLVADHGAGQVNGGKDQAHGKAHGQTDQYLQREKQQPRPGGRVNRYAWRQRRGEGKRWPARVSVVPGVLSPGC